MLNDVAVEKAEDVCPEGNDGLPPSLNFWMKGYVTNGRSRWIPYFMTTVINDETAKASPINNPLLRIHGCLEINPTAVINTGVPIETGMILLEKN